VLARLLRQRADGGTLVALEHDAGWADLVTDMLRRESLEAFAAVVHAPLTGEPPWYDRTALDRTPSSVDLLVVDGPPAYADGHGLRREPALDHFEARLTADATVVLDDVDRPGEQQVLAHWQSRLPWDFTVDAAAGLAVGARRA
jgi:hypothetical protein